MHKLRQKQNQSQKSNSINPARSSKVTPKSATPLHPILQLQRSIGNQAVLKLLQSQERYPDYDLFKTQKPERNAPQADRIREVANKGVTGPAGPLPHLNIIQKAFGSHDVSSVEAHTDAQATDANRALSAVGYATGNHVAFAGPPDLHTSAHEAAHVVQQRSGAHLKNNLGEPGDAYERHADAVADLVVQGRHAGPLLDQMVGPAESDSTGAARAGMMQKAATAVQMQPMPKPKTLQMPPEIPGLRESIEKWASIDKIKDPIVRALAKEYVNRPGRIEIPDRVIYDTPYGGNKVIRGIHQPDEDRVYKALYAATNLKKTGKGDKATDWSFEWAADQPAAPQKKTAGEQGMEVGKFAAEQTSSKIIDKTFAVEEAGKHAIEKRYITKQLIYNSYLKGAANLGVVEAESLITGQISGTSVAEAISEPIARWFMKDVLLVSAEVATRAIPIIGWLWLAYDVVDLLISLNEPAERELSPYEMENASIVASVRKYLEGKETAAQLKKATENPLRPYNKIEPLQNDATIVRPH